MKKSVKKYQPGGLVDTDGNPVRDGSNNPIMTGSFPEEDEITARGRAKNAEMLRSFFNRATGRGKEAAAPTATAVEAAPKEAPKAAPKASDGDVDERDRRMEAAANAPKRQDAEKTKPSAAKPRPYKKDYEPQKERFLKENYTPRSSDAVKKTAAPSRARATPAGSEPKQTFASTYSNEGRGRPAPAPIARKNGAGTALPKSEGVLKRQEADEKRREGRREQGRIRDAEKAAKRESEFDKFNKAMKGDTKQKELKATREKDEKMSSGQRSAARGKEVKEFFGIKSKPNLDPKGAMIQSMDTDVMRNQSRAAAKRNDKTTYKQGGSVSSASKRADGIAQRGKTRGRVY